MTFTLTVTDENMQDDEPTQYMEGQVLIGNKDQCIWTVGNSVDNDIYLLKYFSFFDTCFIIASSPTDEPMIKDVSILDKESVPLITCKKNQLFDLKTNDILCLGEVALYNVLLKTDT